MCIKTRTVYSFPSSVLQQITFSYFTFMGETALNIKSRKLLPEGARLIHF